MNRRPPVLAPSALDNRPPVQNWIEEEQGSIILRSGTVSEAPYIRIAAPKIRIRPKPSRQTRFNSIEYLYRAVNCSSALRYCCLNCFKWSFVSWCQVLITSLRSAFSTNTILLMISMWSAHLKNDVFFSFWGQFLLWKKKFCPCHSRCFLQCNKKNRIKIGQ